MVKIFIDPGHGGTDPGASGHGLLEKNVTLQISKIIRDMLSAYEGVQVKMSRDTDKTVSLTTRTNMANDWGADFLLSVHINSDKQTANGYEDYIFPGTNVPETTYQNLIHQEVIKETDFRDRGKKEANFHMLRESNMPAILTENGFIDNPTDAANLSRFAYLERIAYGHVQGLVRAFRLAEKEPSAPYWEGMEFKEGQIGRITVLKPINLWKRDENDELHFARILQPGERYRVYGYDNLYGGQYDVGVDYWVTNIEDYIEYETPAKDFLNKARVFYQNNK